MSKEESALTPTPEVQPSRRSVRMSMAKKKLTRAMYRGIHEDPLFNKDFFLNRAYNDLFWCFSNPEDAHKMVDEVYAYQANAEERKAKEKARALLADPAYRAAVKAMLEEEIKSTAKSTSKAKAK